MNYDLAMMALEGLARAPIRLRNEGGEIILEAEQASFKELEGAADNREPITDNQPHDS